MVTAQHDSEAEVDPAYIQTADFSSISRENQVLSGSSLSKMVLKYRDKEISSLDDILAPHSKESTRNSAILFRIDRRSES